LLLWELNHWQNLSFDSLLSNAFAGFCKGPLTRAGSCGFRLSAAVLNWLRRHALELLKKELELAKLQQKISNQIEALVARDPSWPGTSE
jgi:AAA+ ATPase superfamily predicted ATPase